MPSIIAVIGTLAGVVVGLWFPAWREWRQKKKRHLSYWSAMSAEVDLCAGLAEAYTRDRVKAPLYRLPTIAYDNGFPALVGDGEVSEDEAPSILRFYAQVVQINRGLEYAHAAAAGPNASEEWLDREVSRLMKKAKDLFDPACADPGGPYHQGVRAAIDRHVMHWRPPTSPPEQGGPQQGRQRPGRLPGVLAGRAMTNIERGLRRIILVMSAAVFLVGLGFVGHHEIYQIRNYREEMRQWGTSLRQTSECAQLERNARAVGKEPAVFDASLHKTCAVWREWWSIFPPSPPSTIAPRYWYWNLAFVGAIGFVVSAAFAATPWGLFYLVRWIVKGFGQ
jgi:hypothetical protein